MEKCQEHRIPRPYLEVTAAALFTEVFGVCHLGPRLLEPGQAVQTHCELPCGPKSMEIGVRMMKKTVKSIPHLAGGRLVSPSSKTVFATSSNSGRRFLISIAKSEFYLHVKITLKRDMLVHVRVELETVAFIHVMSCLSCVCLTFISGRKKASISIC